MATQRSGGGGADLTIGLFHVSMILNDGAAHHDPAIKDI
jgi:hypothetical protein